MIFSSTFMHAVTFASVPRADISLSSLLPPAVDYSPSAAEHLIYLKAAGYTEFPANTRYSQQNFHSYLLLFTHEGRATLQYENGVYTIRPNTILFIDCRMAYTLICSTICKFSAVFFDGYPVPYYYELYHKIAPPVLTLSDGTLFPHFFQKLSGQDFTYPDLINANLLTEILTHLLYVCQSSQKTDDIPAWLNQLRAHLEKSYTTRFSLDELSDDFHINKYQICRDFKKYFKTTPLHYLNAIRLEHARSLLEETSESVGEIGWRVGFLNPTHFIQLFKREYGITPAMYRKKFSQMSKK